MEPRVESPRLKKRAHVQTPKQPPKSSPRGSQILGFVRPAPVKRLVEPTA